MRSRLFLLLLAALAGPTLPSSAFALANIGTWSFLRNSPAELFTQEDWTLFEATLMKALDADAQGEVKTWENPKSEFSGEITVIKSLTKGNNECRAVLITNQAADRSRSDTQIFCRKGGGQWQLEAPPSRVK